MADTVLNVLLHGQLVGTLVRLGGDRILFSFVDDYIENDKRPTLSVSFQDEFGDLLLRQKGRSISSCAA